MVRRDLPSGAVGDARVQQQLHVASGRSAEDREPDDLWSGECDGGDGEADGEPFEPQDVDARRVRIASQIARDGQGAFRARLLDAYGRRCAVTGEHTEPVLDAAHIQPYLGPRSNHVQNGLLLTKEFHTLFDLGYVGITPDYAVRVSPALEADWHNGRRYYEYADRKLVAVPKESQLRPSAKALEWHLENVFKRAS